MSLQPCPSCARHVRGDEQSCPFCRAELAPPSPHRKHVGRLARAAVFAGATLLTTACGDDSTDTTPPPVDSSTGTDSGGGTDSSVAMDSGGGTDAGGDMDAGDTADTGPALPDVGIAPPYGAPPVRDRLV